MCYLFIYSAAVNIMECALRYIRCCCNDCKMTHSLCDEHEMSLRRGASLERVGVCLKRQIKKERENIIQCNIIRQRLAVDWTEMEGRRRNDER